MPSISVTYSDAQIARAETALRAYYPWDEDDGPTDTRTSEDLIVFLLTQHLGQIVQGHEGQAAKAALASC